MPAGKKVLKLNWQLPVPITNHYETPQTLGMDRLAAVVGANFLYPDRDILVLDAGTCITCDYIDKNKNYQGGSITLGLDMKF
ncbi:MAG: pantothenate kinase, partial [Cytophagales bacterium CG18_big_fil_WC_8_21_14_2_50_42_9]